MKQLPIQGMTDLVAMGELLAASGMFSEITSQQGFVIALHLYQNSMSPIEFVEKYHIVYGRVTMRADAMLAGLIECGGSYDIVKRDEEIASIKIKIAGKKTLLLFELKWQDAEKEKFTKKKDGTIKENWSTPRMRMQMLWARVVSDAVRATFPQVCAGSYTPEEVEDFDDHAPVEIEIPGGENVTRDSVQQSLNIQGDGGEVKDTPQAQVESQPGIPEKGSPHPGNEDSNGAADNPFPKTNFKICPIPGVPMTGVRWDTLSAEHLNQALGIKHDTMLPEHFDAIRAVLKGLE